MSCNKVKYNSQSDALKAADRQREKKGVLRAYLYFDCGMKMASNVNASRAIFKTI